MQISVYDTHSSRKLCSRLAFRCLHLHKCQFCCSHDLQFGIHFVDSAPPMNFAMALVNNPCKQLHRLQVPVISVPELTTYILFINNNTVTFQDCRTSFLNENELHNKRLALPTAPPLHLFLFHSHTAAVVSSYSLRIATHSLRY